MKKFKPKPKPTATDGYYSQVRSGNYVLQYRDYILGYQDGLNDGEYHITIPFISRATEDFFYAYGYSDGFHGQKIKRDVEM